jgi:hypothetical protein
MSITADTPILCKINDKVVYRVLNDISNGDWKIVDNIEESTPINNVELWSDMGFIKVKKIIRHFTIKEIYNINVKGSSIDITSDYPLVDNKLSTLTIFDITAEIKLLTHTLPKPIRNTYTSFEDELNAYDIGILLAGGIILRLPKNDDHTKWMNLGYHKKVPDCILSSDESIQRAYIEGFECGYNNQILTKISSAGINYIYKNLGFNVDSSSGIIKFGLNRRQRRNTIKITPLGKTDKYVYNVDTGGKRYSAGIGELIINGI